MKYQAETMQFERPLRITVLKSRYGACGEIGIIFDAAHATFREA